MIDRPTEVTEEQLNEWTEDFNSWDLCDQTCMNLFSYTPFAWDYASVWAERDEEFVKRAAFALQASLAVHEKKTPDEDFLRFFPVIESAAADSRNYVKKAVNWSLRQIGKRSNFLRERALTVCERLDLLESKPARWIARDAARELTSDAVLKRLGTMR